MGLNPELFMQYIQSKKQKSLYIFESLKIE